MLACVAAYTDNAMHLQIIVSACEALQCCFYITKLAKLFVLSSSAKSDHKRPLCCNTKADSLNVALDHGGKAQHYSRNTCTWQGQLTFANFWVDDSRVDSLHAFLSLQAEDNLCVFTFTKAPFVRHLQWTTYFVNHVCLPAARVLKGVPAVHVTQNCRLSQCHTLCEHRCLNRQMMQGTVAVGF